MSCLIGWNYKCTFVLSHSSLCTRSPGCGKQVSWTYSGINDHLKSHNLSMAEYEMKYHASAAPEDLTQVEQYVTKPVVPERLVRKLKLIFVPN